MPELPEVETVRKSLKEKIQSRTIKSCKILYNGIISYPTPEEFTNNIQNQKINDIKRYGKWLIFILDNYYLYSHLRMEGKYFIKDNHAPYQPHEHIIFKLDNNKDLRYMDVRKFGKMLLIEKNKNDTLSPLNNLGLEPWDERLTTEYLKDKLQKKHIPIKTTLLDQSIITGIGNIYSNEILFASQINPNKKSNTLHTKELEKIITNTRIILEKAIKEGGTTIRSYTSLNGIHGKFQQNLCVHNKEGQKCPVCNEIITKITINGRGTYYCPKCQK